MDPPGAAKGSADPSRAGVPALRLVWPLAALALGATILGRMVAPAAVGVAVGTGLLVRALEIAGDVLSQLFAVFAVCVGAALLGAMARSHAPYALRIGAILAGSFVMLIVLHATIERVPGSSSALIGVLAAALAIGAAWDAWRAPFARPAALVVGLTGAGALIRLMGVALAIRAADAPSPGLAGPARGFATAAFVVDGLSILVAVAALAPRRRAAAEEGSPLPLASPLVLLALVLSFLAARQGLAGGREDAGTVDLIVRRALDRLLARPAPLFPIGAQLFAAALALLAALVLLAARREVAALAGALALALVARSAPDAPLGALSLVIAATGLALAARDDRGLWAAILSRAPAKPVTPATNTPSSPPDAPSPG